MLHVFERISLEFLLELYSNLLEGLNVIAQSSNISSLNKYTMKATAS